VGPIAQANIEVIWPCLSGAIESYPLALEQALNSPIGAPRLEHLVSPGTQVAIVVDDPSRWTPVSEALPIVLSRLHAAGVHVQDVTISVGVGRHCAVDREAMQRRLGEPIAARYRCFSPPVDDLSAYEDLGRTPEGVPVRVFRPVAHAGLRILIGSVLPHLQAGFGGGYKLIFPGTCHRTTLGSLHSQGLQKRPDSVVLLGGDAASNPMRQAIGKAASRLGPCWSISHVMGGARQVFQVVAGDPDHVQDLLGEEVRRRFVAQLAQPADIVVAGNDPWPGDPMQSFKVLLHHRAASRLGGVLVGLFWTDPEEIDRSFPTNVLRGIAATGSLGAWTIRRALPLAQWIVAAGRSPASFMLHWARELVVERFVFVYSPPLHERVGPRLGPVRVFAEQGALWESAAAALDGHDTSSGSLRACVFPHGGLTYVPS
jgi:hypothetical protein